MILCTFSRSAWFCAEDVLECEGLNRRGFGIRAEHVVQGFKQALQQRRRLECAFARRGYSRLGDVKVFTQRIDEFGLSGRPARELECLWKVLGLGDFDRLPEFLPANGAFVLVALVLFTTGITLPIVRCMVSLELGSYL